MRGVGPGAAAWHGIERLALRAGRAEALRCAMLPYMNDKASRSMSFRPSGTVLGRYGGTRLAPPSANPSEVDAHDKDRGYEIGKGQFLLVEDEELEAIEIASTHTIDIDSFVLGAEIDRRFFGTP
jgi:hypothetical protein